MAERQSLLKGANMITKEELKSEIDKVSSKDLDTLYRIIQAFEPSDEASNLSPFARPQNDKKEWARFVRRFAGSMRDYPIERGHQGAYENRAEMVVRAMH